MTKVVLTKSNGRITEVNVEGHTGYAEHGQDIVCAALSATVQYAALGLKDIVGLDINLKQNDEKGTISFKLPQCMTEKQSVEANAILLTMRAGIADLVSGYPEFIKLEEK